MKKQNLDIIKILPSEFNEKYNYIKVEGKYICIMAVISYDKVVFLELLDQLFFEEEIVVSFHIEKQNGNEFLKKVTRFVSESGAEIRSIKKNQIDIELIEKNKKEAEDIKKEVQVNNEEVFLVETYIKISGNSEGDVVSKCNNLKNTLYSRGIILRPTFFKQKEGYKAILPLLCERKLLSEYTSNIFLTTSFSMLFPFYVKDNIIDGGVFIGKTNSKYFKLSLLTNKNLNHNMCVFGSSGVGKSFFVKLLILRKTYRNINQIIIDPEGEYVSLVRNIGGKVIEIDTYNPMYIEENFARNNLDFLNQTIEQAKEYVKEKYGVKGKDNEIEKHINKLFERYNITENIESLYEYGNKENIYILPKYKSKFPKLSELLEMLNITDSSLKENLEIASSNIYCFALKGSTSKEIKREIKLFMPKIKSLITDNTLIYFDEIWKLISTEDNSEIIEEIYNFFKTLRKRKAGVVAISQDIGDLFNIDNGNFGKSILNNSYTKVFFKMSYADMDRMQVLSDTNLDIKKVIYKLTRGEAFVVQGESKFIIDVIANNYETELIEKEKLDEKSIDSNG